jgi:hypothetical protein
MTSKPSLGDTMDTFNFGKPKKQDNVYFAKKEGTDLANVLVGKIGEWQSTSRAMGYTDKIKQCWASYHGMFFQSFAGSHQISFGGEQGELANLPVNHIRNIAQHMKTMTIASRPALDARAANTDPKSLIQAQLATGLLDYYMREKRLERFVSTAVEYAIVLGAGYVKMEWDTSVGKIIEEDEETGTVIREGDIKFTNLSPFEVIFDISKDSQEHDWIITIAFKNRYDLTAKFPEYEDEILGLDGKDKYQTLVMNKQMATDEVPIFTFYHKPTDSLPNGREVVFLSEKVVLTDQDLPYKKIPVYRIAPNEVLGTTMGYSSLFDLIPLQEAINTVYTSIFSNQVAFGTQNIFVKTGSNISMSNLSGGLNIIEGLEKPEILNLLGTSADSFSLVQKLEGLMETLSGVNSVTRGNPEANLKSGTSLALVQSMSIQFISGLQQQYVQLLEDVGTGIIEILKDYATEPRVASIVGKNNKAYLKEFKSDDLQEVNRVVVDVGNPLAKTTAGRIQMAEQLMQMKADEFSIEQYIQVLNTGKLEVMTDRATRKINQMEMENERLMDGKPVRALAIDDHASHIKEHATLLDDPEIRFDDEHSKIILDHIQEHISLGQNTDPALLQVLGYQPIQPPMQPAPDQGQAPMGDSGQPSPGDVMQDPGQIPNQEMPPQPSPAQPPEGVATPQQGLANIVGNQG